MKILPFVSSIGAFLGLALVAMLAWAFYLSWNQKQWDRRIDELCAANGGANVATRVYETAVAPETLQYFADTKNLKSFGIVARRVGENLGPLYPYVIETIVVETLHEENPSVRKYTERIVRTRDQKVLAERFAYQRSGGGVALFDPEEIRSCPILKTEDRLDVRVFVNHPQHLSSGTK